MWAVFLFFFFLFLCVSVSCFESVPELSLWQQEGRSGGREPCRVGWGEWWGGVGWLGWGECCRSHYRWRMEGTRSLHMIACERCASDLFPPDGSHSPPPLPNTHTHSLCAQVKIVSNSILHFLYVVCVCKRQKHNHTRTCKHPSFPGFYAGL